MQFPMVYVLISESKKLLLQSGGRDDEAGGWVEEEERRFSAGSASRVWKEGFYHEFKVHLKRRIRVVQVLVESSSSSRRWRVASRWT